jgi:Ca2+-binding RTX toxin-like protein
MSATTSSLQLTNSDEITVVVQNTGDAGSLQTHLIVKLPDSLTLLGPPYYERGSGCTGTSTIDCFLDYIPNGAGTPVRFAVRADAPGPTTVTATASSDRDSNSSDNTAALTLTVFTPAAPPVPVPAPTVARAPHTRSGSAHGDRLTGTTAGDLLYGLGGNDVLLGGQGNDILYGGPGNDLLNGGAGRDRLYGGPGSDVLQARDGQRDVVDCGPGRDTAIVDRLDRVSGCEIVRRRARG